MSMPPSACMYVRMQVFIACMASMRMSQLCMYVGIWYAQLVCMHVSTVQFHCLHWMSAIKSVHACRYEGIYTFLCVSSESSGVCSYVRVCICAYTHTHACIHTSTTHIQTYVHTHTYTHIHCDSHIHTYTCAHIHMRMLHTHIHTYIQAPKYIHTCATNQMSFESIKIKSRLKCPWRDEDRSSDTTPAEESYTPP
jgi:hypothetical protein